MPPPELTPVSLSSAADPTPTLPHYSTPRDSAETSPVATPPGSTRGHAPAAPDPATVPWQSHAAGRHPKGSQSSPGASRLPRPQELDDGRIRNRTAEGVNTSPAAAHKSPDPDHAHAAPPTQVTAQSRSPLDRAMRPVGRAAVPASPACAARREEAAGPFPEYGTVEAVARHRGPLAPPAAPQAAAQVSPQIPPPSGRRAAMPQRPHGPSFQEALGDALGVGSVDSAPFSVVRALT